MGEPLRAAGRGGEEQHQVCPQPCRPSKCMLSRSQVIDRSDGSFMNTMRRSQIVKGARVDLISTMRSSPDRSYRRGTPRQRRGQRAGQARQGGDEADHDGDAPAVRVAREQVRRGGGAEPGRRWGPSPHPISRFWSWYVWKTTAPQTQSKVRSSSTRPPPPGQFFCGGGTMRRARLRCPARVASGVTSAAWRAWVEARHGIPAISR